MSLWHLALVAASAFFVLASLFAGTFGLLFCERFVQARTQHRDGPGRGGRVDYWQVWTDFRKVRTKAWDPRAGLPPRFRAALSAWVLLPFAFLLVLFSPLVPESVAEAELPVLLLLPLLGTGIEALFMHATADTRERYEWRKRLMLRIMGASTLFLAVAAVSLRVGRTDLASVSALQAHFPYHALLSSPGLFLSAIGAFAAVFLFAAESPVERRDELSLRRSLQYMLFFVNKMWIFCLLCLWVHVFLGGFGPLAVRLLFPLKLVAMLFLFTLVQVSLPRLRSSDAIEITARWLLRLCLVGFLLEVLWMGGLG